MLRDLKTCIKHVTISIKNLDKLKQKSWDLNDKLGENIKKSYK